MADQNTSFSDFAEVALAISDASAIESVCSALESGRLSRESTAVTRGAIAAGDDILEFCLRRLQESWTIIGSDMPGRSVALALRTAVAAVSVFSRQVPSTQVVWTGPKVNGSYLRSTREVVREILRTAQSELLVVGYWIATRDDREGIIDEVIALLVDAVRRRVNLNIVLDERVRPDGSDNRHILMSEWPSYVPLPKIFTWKLPPGDQNLKLHAKVLVADRRDALVTSANLTTYALERNMEMGVRIVGRPAGEIASHFDLLKSNGVLGPFS